MTIAYKVSFTTGGLYYREAVKVATIYLELGDWSVVRANILEKNLLQARTQSALIRTTRELIQRLQLLTHIQLEILVNGTRQEQNQIMWLAVCKQYQFIREFAIEVIAEKFRRLDPDLSLVDYDAFFNAKAEWNEDLDHLTGSTKKKLRQVLFRMLREAEILSKANTILPAVVSPAVAQSLANEDPVYLSIFPTHITEIQKQVIP